MAIKPKKENRSRLFEIDPTPFDHLYKNHQDIVNFCASWPQRKTFTVPAGYTYWGQFIAHDIAPRFTLDAKRTSSLDLDSVYGTSYQDPNVEKLDGGLIRLGNTAGPGPYKRDFVREPNGRRRVAKIPEPRNDENLLVAQFHIFIIRLHNCIARILKGDSDIDDDGERMNYNASRMFVVDKFRYLVIEEYLKVLTDNKVYQAIFEEGKCYMELPENMPVPVECVDAAFRFGHSMVRETYKLNEFGEGQVPLKDIFHWSAHGGGFNGNGELPKNKVVDWRHFFSKFGSHAVGDSTNLVQGAMPIQPTVVPPMQGSPHPDIIKKNILAGIFQNLSSGQKVAAKILSEFPHLKNELGVLPDLDFTDHPIKEQKFIDAGIRKETPLWIYILTEARLSKQRGNKLGPLGSLLLCEIIRDCKNNGEEMPLDGTKFLNPHSDKSDLNEFYNCKCMYDLVQFVESHEGA